jgi:hypothetical protein
MMDAETISKTLEIHSVRTKADNPRFHFILVNIFMEKTGVKWNQKCGKPLNSGT